MLSLLVWNSLRLMETALVEQLENRITQIQPLLHASLAGPLLQEDIASIKEVTQQISSEEIGYVAVYNSLNENLATTGKPKLIDTIVHGETGRYLEWRKQEDLYLLRFPIAIEQQLLGHVDLEINTGLISLAIGNLKKQGTIIASIEVVLTILLLGLLGYALTRHLFALTQAAESMAAGDMSIRIPTSSDDEIGKAASTFNRMAEVIQTSYDKLRENDAKVRSLNDELEQRVEDRTFELKLANKKLEKLIENLNKTQSQLIQSEKMAALGQLVAGVAHEINTPVGISVTAASHFQLKSDQFNKQFERGELTDQDIIKYIKTSMEASNIVLSNMQRASKLIQSFKKIAVDQSSNEIRVFKLKEYLEEIFSSLHPQLKRGKYIFDIECPSDLELTSVPGAYSQIITNLIINSINHGFEGRLDGKISISVKENVDMLEIEYKDDGVGIPKENITKVFEPFFTTKRNQGGSGLGLQIVYNLVTQVLCGTIQCFSTLGEGTTFLLSVPLDQKIKLLNQK